MNWLQTIAVVLHVLLALGIVGLVLLQRGKGADAGAGFGAGASGTVFGARGASTFLSRTTGILAGLFFLLSLGMGIYLHGNGAPHTNAEDLGVMAALADKPATGKATPAAPAAGSEVPAAPAATNNAVPAAQPAATPAPTQSQGEVPAATEPPAKH